MKQFDLVLEGGGAKGSVFAGALDELESRGYTYRRFVGTSAGAIAAALLAAGYTAAELLEATNERLPNGKSRFTTFMDVAEKSNFKQRYIEGSLTYTIFRDINLPFVPDRVETRLDDWIFDKLTKVAAYREMFSFIERGGLYAGDKFVEWIKEKLDAKKAGWGDSTLSRFHAETGNDVSMVVSDTTGQEMLVLNHRTAPDCPTAWAVRMSMSIPFLWQEVRWAERWGKYLGRSITDHVMVDGGALSNFPIDLLTSTDEQVVEIMGDTPPDEVPNLGLLIDETIEVPGSGEPLPDIVPEDDPTDDDLGERLKLKRLKTLRRVGRLVNTMTKAHDKLAMEAHADEVCRLPAFGYGTTEFDMTEERMTALVDAGRAAMKAFLDARNGA